MKFLSLRLAGLLALLGLLGLPAGAAPAPAEFTAKELAQGYRDTVVLAKPRASQRNTVDAAEAAEGRRLRQKFDRFGDLRVLEVGSGETVTQAMQRLRRTGRYEYVEPDHIVHGHVQPNDPYFPSAQWSLNNTGSNGPGGGTPGADIGALTAWSSTTVANSASNVIVAVVDSGALLAHEDLAPNLWTDGSGHHGASYVSGNGAQTDTNPNDTEVGHGSHVSGIIGAAGNNSTGISGIAWSVKLMELRFLHGTAGSGSISDAIACVNYAISNGAKIINASYGSDAYSSAEYDAIKAARDAGVIFVASAGNDTANVDTGAAYPAGYDLDNIVTVAATTNTDALATYSNYGAGDVDLAAPGSSIYSCWYTATNAYATESGTSMAAPHVSGVLALMRAKFPSDTYRQLINRLLRSVTPVAGLIGKVQSGGRLNLANALNVTDPRPFNDDFASRASLGTAANIHIRTNNVGATSEVNEPALAGSTAQNTLWWTWTAPASANVTFNTAGTAYTAGFAVYTGNSLTGLTKVVDNSGGQTKVTAAVTAGTTYQIAIGTKGGSPGLTVFAIGVVPPNDDFVNAQLVSGRTFRVSATTFNASTESGETLAMSHGAGHTVWYKWVAPSSGTFGLYLYSDLADMLAGVYNAFPSSQSRVAYNDDAADQILSGTYNGAVNSASLVRFAATAGTTYYFQVDTTNVNPVGGDFTLTITDAVWQFAAYGGVVSSPAVGSDGTIYVGAGTTLTDDPLDNSNYPEDRVYALNANGTKKWSYATGQPVDLSSPAIGSDGTVYIGSGSKKLYALDGSTGAFKWSFTATTAVIASPVVATDGTVYFRDDTTLYALKSDGTQKWTFALAGGTYASPGIAADGTVYVGATGGNFYAINPDGAKKWATPFTANGDIYTSPAIANDGTIYFGTLNGYFYALKPDGTQKWVWDKLAGSSITSSPVLAPDGTIYFGAYDHKLHALTDNGSSASEKWSYTMGDEVRAATPAVAASGTVYMPDYDGYIYAISSSGTLVTTYATGTLLRSSPMIANGQLIVGAADGLVYAFALDPVADTAPASSPWPVFLHNQRHDGQYTANFVTITTAPVAQTFAIGSALTLSVAATGPGTLTYQWYKDGNAISGATGAIYTKSNAQTGDSGSYTVKVTSSTGPTATSAPVNITVAAGTLGRLVNLSVRTTAGTGAQTLIAGFVINGGTKSILVRGIGPTLTTYSVAGALPDPRLELYAGGASTPSYTNTAWGGDPSLTAAFTATGAFALTNPASKDTALLVSLAPGVYSAQIKGNSGDTGIALAEIYDADGTVAVGKLVNVSARAQVGTGDGILIAGFVISGTLNKTVLIRGIGPALANYGVTGSLPDPRLELYASGSTTPMNSNTGWGGAAELSAAFTATGAFALTDPNSKDTALLVSLPPGVYSAQVKGASGDTGVALIEVYEVP